MRNIFLVLISVMLLVACQQKEHQPSVMFGQADEVRAADYDLEDIQASGELRFWSGIRDGQIFCQPHRCTSES